ncbi:MAG: hypothetical protein KTR31_37935 [Myxococcales bacterium]|nr:hypothetical protein [Myxococcales bacterium]
MLWVLSTAWAGVEIWEVGPELALQEAIDVSSPGDVIQITQPVIAGSFRVEHALTIEAAPGVDVTAVVEQSDTASLGGFVAVHGDAEAPFTVVLRDLTIDGRGVHRLASVSNATLRLEQVVGHSGYHGSSAGCLTVQAGARLELQGSQLRDCNTPGDGAAVVVRHQGVLVANDVVFEGNTAKGNGGALRCAGSCALSAAQFLGNHSSGDGGAMSCSSDCVVHDSLFVGNQALDDAGAIDVRLGSLDVQRSRFCDNSATYRGGAIQLMLGAISPLVAHNVFWGNHASESGGALSTNVAAVVQNSTFIDNDALLGGTVRARLSADVLVVNSIVVDHEGVGEHAFTPDDGVLTVDRVLHWDSDDDEDRALFEPSVDVPTPPLTADPAFVVGVPTSCADDDLHLTAGSPAIGAGNPDYDDDLGAFPWTGEEPTRDDEEVPVEGSAARGDRPELIGAGCSCGSAPGPAGSVILLWLCGWASSIRRSTRRTRPGRR